MKRRAHQPVRRGRLASSGSFVVTTIGGGAAGWGGGGIGVGDVPNTGAGSRTVERRRGAGSGASGAAAAGAGASGGGANGCGAAGSIRGA